MDTPLDYIDEEDEPEWTPLLKVLTEQFVDPYTVYVACEEGGVYRIELEPIIKLHQPFSSDSYSITRFATDLDVDDIVVKGNQAALCLGSKGLALFDVTEPDEPVSRGIFDIGHTYHATFYQEHLFVATREGMQIFEVGN